MKGFPQNIKTQEMILRFFVFSLKDAGRNLTNHASGGILEIDTAEMCKISKYRFI